MFMKKTTLLFFAVSLFGLVSCNNEETGTEQLDNAATKKIVLQGVDPAEGLFPEDDGATSLAAYDPNIQIYRLLRVADDTLGTSLGTVQITAGQYAEIAEAVEKIIAGKRTEKAKYNAIFKWVVENTKYDSEGVNIEQSAYVTFTSHRANCQGYSNLINVMTHCAGLRSFNVNGYLIYNKQYLGHAWSYVHADNIWYVCDATNNRQWSCSGTSNYKDKLCPQSTDIAIWEDDTYTYSFYNGLFGITRVKNTEGSILVVPFSKNGFQISIFNPMNKLSKDVKQIYLGKSVKSLGESYNLGLRIYDTKSLEAVHVDPENPYLASHKGVVYRRDGEKYQLDYVPTGADYIELSPKLYCVEKRTLADNRNVNVLYIPEGVSIIEQYAVEECPNLHYIYVPQYVNFVNGDGNMVENPTSKTFYNVASDCQVIRGPVPTGIVEVKM